MSSWVLLVLVGAWKCFHSSLPLRSTVCSLFFFAWGKSSVIIKYVNSCNDLLWSRLCGLWHVWSNLISNSEVFLQGCLIWDSGQKPPFVCCDHSIRKLMNHHYPTIMQTSFICIREFALLPGIPYCSMEWFHVCQIDYIVLDRLKHSLYICIN